MYMLACPKGHKVDKPGQFFRCAGPDGPCYCPECNSVLEKTELKLEAPWHPGREEFVQAVAEAVGRALYSSGVVGDLRTLVRRGNR